MLTVCAATVVFVGVGMAAPIFAGTSSIEGGPTAAERQVPPSSLDVMEHSRNERSTPRDSVLPVSPAIARPDQDAHTETNTALILRTKAFLVQLGYDVGRLDGRITAKLKAAIFRYQQAHGLPVSGELDDATIRNLGSGIP